MHAGRGRSLAAVRWEEDGGYSPFTLTVAIAALVTAAEFADAAHEADAARSDDDWRTTSCEETIDTTLGLWYADLPTDGLTVGAQVRFTVYWPEASRWEGTDFLVSST